MDEETQVPVFTSVSDIEFPLNERTPRQVITLYNPYKYMIQYKVLCTAPTNYTVAESNGLLNGLSCKDIVIRCTARLPIGCVDRLRIEVRKRNETQLHGCKDITLRTVGERTRDSSVADHATFHGVTESRTRNNSERRYDPTYESSMMPLVLVGIACAVALALPTVPDASSQKSSIPEYLHLTLPQKLVASFILGVVTTLILRPS